MTRVEQETPSGSRIPPTPKGRDARARLLDAGRAIFGAAGYSGARVVDLTDAAGLSQGAFYRYFRDRHDLLLVLLKGMLDEAYVEARAPWDPEHPFESVRLTTERYFVFYERNRGLMATMTELIHTDAAVRAIWTDAHRAFYDRIERTLRRGIDAGVVRADLDVQLAAELLGSMSEFYAFQRLALPDDRLSPVPLEDAARVLTAIWTDGVRAESPEPEQE